MLVLDLLIIYVPALDPSRESKGTYKAFVKCSTTVTKYKDFSFTSTNGYRLVHMFWQNEPTHHQILKQLIINYKCDSSFKERKKIKDI